MGGRAWRRAAARLLALALVAGTAGAAPATPALLAQAEALLASDAAQAERLAQRELEEARGRHDVTAQAQAQMLLGLVQMRRGQHAAALQQLEAALPLAERSGSRRLLGRNLASLGIVYDLSGLRSEALAVQQRALDLYLQDQEWGRASALLINLGNTYANQGDVGAARASYERALAMKKEHGVTKGLGSVLNNLADFELDAQRGAAAVALLREAIQAHRTDGNPGAESLARGNLARALALTGNYEEAQHELEAATMLARRDGDALAELAALTAEARVLLTRARASASGDPRRGVWLERAAQAGEAARRQARGLEDHGRLADLARLLADVRVEQGRHETAVALLRDAEAEQQRERERADAERYAVLAARYRAEKQAGEIALLRQRESTQQALLAEREATQRAELGRERGWQVALALAVLGLALGLGLLWHRSRDRQAHAATLEAGNRALAAALREAERLRARSEQIAAVNRRLLHLAGEEMRAPLLMLRGGAERLLVDDGSAGVRSKRVAAVAQASAELLRVADQMLESAALEVRGEGELATLALDGLLRDLVEQLRARAQGRARDLVLRRAEPARVRGDAARLALALQELIELALAAAPAGATVDIGLRCRDGEAQLDLSDPGGGFPDPATARRVPVGGLGFAWACEVLEGSGGRLQPEQDARGRRGLRVVLPCAADSGSA